MLVKAHRGDIALLYLYQHLTGGHDIDSAAEALCMTGREVTVADEILTRALTIQQSLHQQRGSKEKL